MPELIVDENVPRELIVLLKKQRLDVLWITKSEYRGINDIELVELAKAQDAIIVTRDRDLTDKGYTRSMKKGVVYIKVKITKTNINKILELILYLTRNAPDKVATITEEFTYIETND